jgi:hypothetical protein
MSPSKRLHTKSEPLDRIHFKSSKKSKKKSVRLACSTKKQNHPKTTTMQEKIPPACLLRNTGSGQDANQKDIFAKKRDRKNHK